MISVRSDREQAEIVDAILKERLDTVLKDAMQESGIDTWLILSREYCEDPLFKLLTPAMYLTARRLTILIFHLENDKVGKYCCNIADPLLESIYTNIYTDNSNNQFVVLNEFLKELKPQKIALNYSNNYAYFDGLSKALYDKLQSNLDKELSSRFISSESLGILYCEKRSPLELQYYPEIVKVAESIIEEAFSPEFIKPGVTTTEDVEWKMKQSIKDLGLSYWFSPDVNLQNSKDGETMQTGLINKGDLLHCDFGLTYLNLNTDTQRLAYVLKDGEIGIPEDIQRAYDRNMDFHKIVSDNLSFDASSKAQYDSNYKTLAKQIEKIAVKVLTKYA